MRMDIVEKIWAYQGGTGRFGYLDRFDNDRFDETWYFEPQRACPGVDLYFTPGIFLPGEKRSNTNMIGFSILWADLDSGYKQAELEYLPPTILWETSPGNMQGVWFLEDDLDTYEEWARVNKALTYIVGADKGGWHGSKLLRIPGSINWKRWDGATQQAAVGRIVSHTSLVWNNENLKDFLEFEPINEEVVSEMRPNQMPQGTWYAYMAEQWGMLPISMRAALTKERVRDRSAHIWDIAVLGNKMGLHKEQVYHLISGAPFNKYRDRPDVLWQTVCKVYDH